MFEVFAVMRVVKNQKKTVDCSSSTFWSHFIRI